MDELIQEITQRTGLGEGQVRPVVDMTVDFIKQRLPGPAQGMVDQALIGSLEASETEEQGQAQGVVDQVKGFLSR